MPIRYLLFIMAMIFVYFQVQNYRSDENTLNRSLKVYQDALLDKDHETVVDYLYPKLYNQQTSKELLYEKQRKTFDKITITDFKLTPKLPIKKYSEGLYLLVNYSKNITINMPTNGTTDMDKRAQRMAIFFLRESLKKGDNLHLDDSTNTIVVKKHGTFIFINEENSGWKYIDVESTPKKMLKQSLPIDIIDKEQVLILKQKDSMLQEILQSKTRK